jgi:hypothetical protein
MWQTEQFKNVHLTAVSFSGPLAYSVKRPNYVDAMAQPLADIFCGTDHVIARTTEATGGEVLMLLLLVLRAGIAANFLQHECFFNINALIIVICRDFKFCSSRRCTRGAEATAGSVATVSQFNARIVEAVTLCRRGVPP